MLFRSPGDQSIVSISYAGLPADLAPGARVLIDDGLVELTVRRITGSDIVCEVMNGGRVSDHKGINVPGTRLSMPFISERDRADILFGIELGFDFIAASFTRTAEDILAITTPIRERILDIRSNDEYLARVVRLSCCLSAKSALHLKLWLKRPPRRQSAPTLFSASSLIPLILPAGSLAWAPF